ncbi:MAG: 30S ribosomal protein S17 [Actinomycetaceae bacterium]|nr:30S ribosomal protein S17 [Actinomycetaceae bacterium]MDY6082837.1 30S ribosomal protein S17 [Actinomycetaceae bacterium]
MSEEVEATAPAARHHRKVERGYVVSDKMDKTVIVEVRERRKHSLYGKVMTHTRRVKAHDENNEVHVGDLVQIMETRPLSATKHFRVVDIIEKAK